MIEEPYRWLEAIRTRRDYIEDQLLPGQPVVALSFSKGILLATVKSPAQKLFEIYDNMAIGAVGHPADVEKVRQLLIDGAHVEGFSRSPRDVSSRRLVSYNLAPALKAAFEQIFAAPLLFRGLLLEMSPKQVDDVFWLMDYGGDFTAQTIDRPVLVGGSRITNTEWSQLAGVPEMPADLTGAAKLAIRALAWAKVRASRDQSDKGQVALTEIPEEIAELTKLLENKPVQFAFLDRSRFGKSITYRIPTEKELGL